MQEFFHHLCVDERGAALTEYGLLVGLIALAAVTGMTALGADVSAMYVNVGNYLSGIVPA